MTDRAFYWVDVSTLKWGQVGGWSKGRVELGVGGAKLVGGGGRGRGRLYGRVQKGE